MTHIIRLLTAALLCAFAADTAAQDSSLHHASLAEVQRQVDAITNRRPFDFAAYQALLDQARARVRDLVERDSLVTGGDFLLASQLSGDPTGFYESRRVEHELAIMALLLGDTAAVRRVGLTWDGLNWSWGRGQRLGSYKRDGEPTNMDPLPAPVAVGQVFSAPEAARRRAEGAADHAELQQIRDADQADRSPPMDQEKMQRMQANDPIRRARVLELIAADALATGRDFRNAALVMQHGSGTDDFRLAHELALAATILGDRDAAWLLSRTYDRLLLHQGHRQRFGTQSRNGQVMPLDADGINDRMRRALRAPIAAASP